MAASDKNKKQVMDVSKPGKTAAEASSRPVIVGHKPLVQDPMVTAEESKEETTDAIPETNSPAASKKIIAPLSDADKEIDEPNDPDAVSDEPAAADDGNEALEQDEAAEEPAADEAETTEDAEAETPPPETESTDSVVVDAVIDQVGDKKQDELEAEEERKRQESISKLVAEKKYFVPIGKAHRKSGRASLIITLFLLAVLIGVLVAIDAELLDAGFSLPFDLIK